MPRRTWSQSVQAGLHVCRNSATCHRKLLSLQKLQLWAVQHRTCCSCHASAGCRPRGARGNLLAPHLSKGFFVQWSVIRTGDAALRTCCSCHVSAGCRPKWVRGSPSGARARAPAAYTRRARAWPRTASPPAARAACPSTSGPRSPATPDWAWIQPLAIELYILSNTRGDFARHHVEPIVALEGVKHHRGSSFEASCGTRCRALGAPWCSTGWC